MSKIKSILKGLLATAYNQADGEISELLEKPEEEINESDVLSAIKNLDKSRVVELKKSGYQDGYKKAKREVLTDVESRLKSRFEVESEKEGDELFDELFETTVSKQQPGKSKLTDDDVKKHPVFVQMENQFKKQLTDVKTDFENQIIAKDKEYHRKEVFGNVSKEAIRIFESLNPILSADPERAANQKADFIEKFSGYDFENVEGKYIITKDGKVLEDNHGHKVDFSNFVKDTAGRYFDFKVAEDRSAPGKQNNQNPKTSFNGTLPKTKEEYLKTITDTSIPLADRLAIKEAAPAEFK